MICRILTNNTKARDALAARQDVEFVPGDAENVFARIEAILQEGWQLLTSPLPPNVPLIRSQIRSVVLKKVEQKYDVAGLDCLHKARERFQTLNKDHRPEQRGDLEHIDWTFLQRSMLELGLRTSL